MTLFYNFEAFGMLPQISDISENIVNSITWGPWEYNRAFIVPTLIDGAARDQGNTPTDLLRPGLMMGMVNATRKVKEYDNALSDGTEDLMGILLYDVKLQAGGSNQDRWFGFVLVGGNVKANSLIYDAASSTMGGWVGGAQDAAIRTEMADRFILDDMFWQ